MIVRYDSLDRFETPEIFVCSPGCKISNGALTSCSGALTSFTDLEIVFNFNTKSEMNLRVYRSKYDDTEVNEAAYKLYRSLRNKRVLYVADIGFFVIVSVTDGYEDGTQYKDITAESCEVEIENRCVPYIEDGTYAFRSLLEDLVEQVPLWTIGEISTVVDQKYRSFEDVDTDSNILSFMLDDMQDAYECIFEFDITNRVIDVYDQNSYVEETSIHITKDDLINSLTVEESSDELYTAMSVFGEDDLTISAVNPLGGNTIYRFDYYFDWMSDGLKAEVESWENDVADSVDDYITLQKEYYTIGTDLSSAKASLKSLTSNLEQYTRCRANIVAASGDLDTIDESTSQMIDEYNELIATASGETIPNDTTDKATITAEIDSLIATTQNKISPLEIQIADYESQQASKLQQINAIHDKVDMQTRFTTAGYWDELSNYISEGSYTDEYMAVTDSMTQAERIDKMKELYDRAVTQLEKVSEPTREFDIDVENFIFSKEFEPWAEEIKTGCLINVETDDDVVESLFLSNMTVNYEDMSLSMTFGNSYKRYDAKSLYEDALGSISKTANTLSFVKDSLYNVKNGLTNTIAEAIASSRDIAKNNVLSSANEQVVIDDSGYTGAKYDPDTGKLDDHQIKINGRNIVFTDDAWDTCATAIGEITLPDGTVTYGVNAKALIGDLIIGNELRILNDDGTDLFTVVSSVNDLTGPSGQVTINSSQIAQLFTEQDNLAAYIKTGEIARDEADNPIYGVSIGQQSESGDNFSARFTANELGFYQEGEKTAFFSNKKLNVSTMRGTTIQMAKSGDLNDNDDSQWEFGMIEEEYDDAGVLINNPGFYLKWIGESV